MPAFLDFLKMMASGVQRGVSAGGEAIAQGSGAIQDFERYGSDYPQVLAEQQAKREFDEISRAHQVKQMPLRAEYDRQQNKRAEASAGRAKGREEERLGDREIAEAATVSAMGGAVDDENTDVKTLLIKHQAAEIQADMAKDLL